MDRSNVIGLGVLISIIVLVCVRGQVVSSVNIKEKSVSSAIFGIPLNIFNEAQVILFIITIFIAINLFFLSWPGLFGNFRKTESLGLRLIAILAEDQLQGKINLDRSRGTEFN